MHQDNAVRYVGARNGCDGKRRRSKSSRCCRDSTAYIAAAPLDHLSTRAAGRSEGASAAFHTPSLLCFNKVAVSNKRSNGRIARLTVSMMIDEPALPGTGSLQVTTTRYR